MAWTDRYVDASASGGGTGTSTSDPWTFAEAISNSTAGMRVNIKAGVYTITSNTSTSFNGTFNSPVWWRGYKDTVGDLDEKFTGDKTNGTDIPEIRATTGTLTLAANFCLLSGLAFTATASNVTTMIRTGDYGWVKNCRFKHSANSYSAIVSGAANYVTYLNCEFSTYRIETTLGVHSLIYPKSDTSFINCVFYCETANNCSGISADSNRITVRGCVFKNLYRGFRGYAPAQISNSTFVDISDDAIYIDVTTGSTLGTGTLNFMAYSQIISNYFANVSGYCIGPVSASYDLSAILIANNCFYNSPNKFEDVGDAPEFNSLSDTSDQFVDSGNGNYTLKDTSSGYNAGLGGFWFLPMSDYADVGAAQAFCAPSPTTQPSAAGTQIYPFRQFVSDKFGAVLHPLRSN